MEDDLKKKREQKEDDLKKHKKMEDDLKKNKKWKMTSKKSRRRPQFLLAYNHSTKINLIGCDNIVNSPSLF